MASSTRPQDYYTLVREANRKVWEGVKELLGLQAEWNAGDYLNNLPPGSGANDGITSTELGAVVFDTADALETLLQGGHAANMQKLL